MSVAFVAREGRKVQRTLRLPNTLYEQAKTLVEDENKANSINDFIVAAVAAYIKVMHRKIIDEGFCRMAEDTDYQKEAILITEEFADSDAETVSLLDQDLMGA